MVKSLPIAPVEHPWATIVVLLGAAVVFGAIPLALAWLWARFFSPAKPGLQKNATYECGLEAKGDAWVQLDVSYYLYAIVFLIFDVETVFLLPWAIIFMGKDFSFTKFALVEMFVFIAILVVGYYYAWRKGALEWA